MKLHAFSPQKGLVSIFSTVAVVGVFLIFSPFARAVFSDIAYTSKSYVAIETLTEKNIFKGLGDDTFGPDQALNRAQAVTLILRYGGHSVSEEGVKISSFSDVDPKLWYAGPVEQGLNLGIVQGNDDDTFAPANQVESAEFLTMVARTDEIDLSSFQQDAGVWYAPVMAYAKATAIYTSPDPAKVLTREDAANILYSSLLLREGKNSPFLSAQAQNHLSHVESSVTANQLSTALYHAQWGVRLSEQVQQNLNGNDVALANTNIAQAYLAWVESIIAALEQDHDLALQHIQSTLQYATNAYFKDNSTQPLGAHLKDISCEVYGQLPEPKGGVPEDCVERLAI